MIINQSKISYIKSQSDLNDLCELINGQTLIAIDTEFMREKTYYPILSIIQVAVNINNEKKIFIIDCLCNLDLKGIFQIVSNENITKIIHSSKQDIEIFFNISNLKPKSIFDTQIMSNICGIGFNIGYANLVKEFFHLELDKKQQRSNWQLRPLKDNQVLYAALDVFYLEEIYQKLHNMLIEKNRLSWYLQEINNFILHIIQEEDQENQLFRDFNLHKRSVMQINQIKEILLLRNNWAKKINIPRKHLISNDTIDKIVSNGFDRSEYNFYIGNSNEIIKEIDEIMSDSKLSSVEINIKLLSLSLNNQEKNKYKKSKLIISKVAKQHNLTEQFILNSCILKKIIIDDKLFDKNIFGWRADLIGLELKNIIFN